VCLFVVVHLVKIRSALQKLVLAQSMAAKAGREGGGVR